MHGVLIALSEARIEMVLADDSVLADAIEARRTKVIPGLLSLGKAWDALDVLLSDRGRDPLLGDAVCARSGSKFGPELGFGRGRLLSRARTTDVADALQALPADTIRTRYAKLRGQSVHGGYGPRSVAGPASPGHVDQLIDEYKSKRLAPSPELDELESFARMLLATPEHDTAAEEEVEIDDLRKHLSALVELYVTARGKHQAIYAVVV
jgi:hypothetical protein